MIRDINIQAVLNGYIVKVGCQTVVFESLDSMLGELKSYCRDPEFVERSYLENAINAKQMFGNQPRAAQPEPPSLEVARILRQVSNDLERQGAAQGAAVNAPMASGIFTPPANETAS